MHLIHVSACPILLPCSHLMETATTANHNITHIYNHHTATQEDSSDFWGGTGNVSKLSGRGVWLSPFYVYPLKHLFFSLFSSSFSFYYKFPSSCLFIAPVKFFHTSLFIVSPLLLSVTVHTHFCIHCLFLFLCGISFILLPLDDPR